MRWHTAAVILSLFCAGQALAQSPQPLRILAPWSSLNGCCNLGCCPDDYCRKPCPALFPLPRCGGPDDYCHKTMPCLRDIPRCGTCDDYCRKTIPALLCPPWSPFLKCGPSTCVSAPSR